MGSTSVSLLAICPVFLFFNATAPTEFNTCGPPLSRHDAIPFSLAECDAAGAGAVTGPGQADTAGPGGATGEASPDPLDVPARVVPDGPAVPDRSEEHTSELQSLMRISYAVFCLKTKKKEHTASQRSIQSKDKVINESDKT